MRFAVQGFVAFAAVAATAAAGVARSYEVGGGAQTLLAQANIERAPDRPRAANRLSEIGPLLSRCLRMPDLELARPGMQVTVRLAFTRDGAVLGEPRFTFTTPGVSPEVKAVYQRAVVDMLNRCTPLAITKELGAAIAGRPLVIPIVETRNEKKAEIADDPKS